MIQSLKTDSNSRNKMKTNLKIGQLPITTSYITTIVIFFKWSWFLNVVLFPYKISFFFKIRFYLNNWIVITTLFLILKMLYFFFLQQCIKVWFSATMKSARFPLERNTIYPSIKVYLLTWTKIKINIDLYHILFFSYS